MSVELYEQDSAPAIVFLLAWMAPISPDGHTGQTRDGNDATKFPFRQITIPGIEADENLYYDQVLASVHTFCEAKTPQQRAAAMREARRTDQRLMLMQDELRAVTLPGGQIVRPETFRITEKSVLSDYKVDTIHRYVARVLVDLPYVAA